MVYEVHPLNELDAFLGGEALFSILAGFLKKLLAASPCWTGPYNSLGIEVVLVGCILSKHITLFGGVHLVKDI